MLAYLAAFWEVENVLNVLEEKPPLTKDEQLAEDLFRANLDMEDGRYRTKLLLKENRPTLRNNRRQVMVRFRALEDRFKRYPEFKEAFKAMNEYLQRHDVELAPP